MNPLQQTTVKELRIQTNRIKQLFKKYKQSIKTRKLLVPLSGPVVFLLRKNNRLEFHEANRKNGIDDGTFSFKHSDGKERKIILNESFMHTADYGNDTFKCFICHEDAAFPLPPQPVIEITEFQNAVNNALSAELKWKAEEKKANARMLIAVAVIFAVLIGGFILFKLLVNPQAAAQTAQTAAQVTTIPVIK